MKLPAILEPHYQHFAGAISQRLAELSALKDEREVFYEFCYCICTPQSKARHAWHVEQQLRQLNFYEQGFDPTPLLANPKHYIRFHRTKAARLLSLRERLSDIAEAIRSITDSHQLRLWVVENVAGFGMKEASHVLRNVGRFELAILDRHILRNLARLGAIRSEEPPRSRSQYELIENKFRIFATHCGVELQVLDLLLWAIETGEVLK
ncbi:MAG: DNA lyase [Chlorobi bacterium]|nr:DNA lyase [Chlorobiota bacterium]